MNKSIKKYWYYYIVGLLYATELLVFLVFRDESYIQVHDNLDLFIPHYKMLSLNHAWYSHNSTMPMLHGINRDLLGSEFLLYNVLYIIFPSIWAYLIGYALKVAIGFISFRLLFKEVLGERYCDYEWVVVLSAAAYSLIPVFPTYGIAFTSVPFIIVLVRRLYLGKTVFQLKGEGERYLSRICLYLGVFLYPLLSYFSYHGFFILCYISVALIYLWIRDRRFPLSIFISICILSLGYIIFEYRLFMAMLFDDTVTIRSSMVSGDLSLLEALKAGVSEFCMASFHNQDSHAYLILIVVIIAIIVLNCRLIINKNYRQIYREPLNLVVLFIVFNCLIFGLCEFLPFRKMLETLVPPLEGFDFSRTSFFNPLLWYIALALVGFKLVDISKKRITLILNKLLVLSSLLIVMLAPQVYNDFYYTIYNQAYKIIKNKETSTVNFREFYSEALFSNIKDEINYTNEWSVAYGLHPAVLVYNGISTLDGYLGMYSQEYKNKWNEIEDEAFRGSPSLAEYYRDWGARVCLYSGNDENTYAPVRIMELEDKRLIADIDGLRDLNLKYIFSRIEFSNAEEIGIEKILDYMDSSSPYHIYVYSLQKK